MDVYAREGYVINLGRAGESNARTIIFDLTSWVDTTLTGTSISLWYAPIGEEFGTVPLANVPYESGVKTLSWTVPGELTSQSKAGRCQLTQVSADDDIVHISPFYDTIITESFRSNDGSIAGQLHEDWLNQMDVALSKMAHLTASARPVSYNEEISVDKQDNIYGSYDLTFSIPEAPPFVITDSYDSENDMCAAANKLSPYDFVMIKGSVEDEESGRLYMRNTVAYTTPSSDVDTYFIYCSDLSGMRGFQGISIQEASISENNTITLTLFDPSNSEDPTSTITVNGDAFYSIVNNTKDTAVSAASAAKSWAVGTDEDIQAGDDTHNSKYYAYDASQSADSASGSADRASQSASSAEQAAYNASQSASGAAQAADDANRYAENAAQAAVSADQSDSNARESASNASGSADSASQSAENAAQAADDANRYASGAASAKTYAVEAASAAKSWAVGDADIQEGDNTHNAMYYASRAENAQQSTEKNELAAKYWAMGKRDADDREFLDPDNPDNQDQFLNNARYYKDYIANMEISTETGAPGTDASAETSPIENSDEPGYHLGLNLVIPRGDKGEPGIYYTPEIRDGKVYWTQNGGQPASGIDIRGPQGVPAGITRATASVTSTTGTPDVVVITGGESTNRTFDFQFSGLKGDKGEQGWGLTVTGRVSSEAALPDAATTLPGTAYGVGATAPYSIYILNQEGGTNRWINYGQLAAAVQEVQIGYYYNGEFYLTRTQQAGGGYIYSDQMNHEVDAVYIDRPTHNLYHWDNIEGQYAKISDIVQSDWEQIDTTAADYIKNKPNFAEVALTGDYADLINPPTFADVASTGSYNDLTDKPNLKTVALTGSYNDLTNKPTIPAAQKQSDWNVTLTSDPAYIKNKPPFATVATSGSYMDLTNKPTIPAAQVQADWSTTNTSDVTFIRNKPNLANKVDKTSISVDTVNHILEFDF